MTSSLDSKRGFWKLLDDKSIPIYFSGFLDLFGVSIVLPLISCHTRELGASPTVTGIIGSLYGFLQFFSSPVVGRWSDVSGRKYCLIWCLVLSAGGYALLGISSSLFLIFIARIPGGIFKHSQTISKSLLADIVPDEHQSAVLGHFNAASSIGFILGPLIGGHIAETPGGFYKVAFISGAIFLLNSVIVWHIIPDTNSRQKKGNENDRKIKQRTKADDFSFNIKEFFKTFNAIDWSELWDLFLIKFCLGFSILIFRTNFILTLKEQFETTPKTNGYIISYTGTVSALFGFTAGAVSNFYRNDARLIIHLAVIQLITLVFLSTSFSLNLFVLWLAPLSFVSTILRVAATRLTIVRGKGREIGTLMGFSQSSMSVARIISPFMSGLALEFSSAGPSMIGAVVTVIAIIVMVIRPQNPQVIHEKKVS